MSSGANIKLFYAACCSPQISAAQSRSWIKLADADGLNEDMIKKIFQGELKGGQVHQEYYFDVARKLTEAISQGLKVKGMGVDNPKTRAFEKFKSNIYAFSAAKSLTVLQEYSAALRDEKGEARSYSAFRNAAIPIGKQFNDDHLRTEFNSAGAKAQMSAKWDRLKKYDMLEYRTVGDSKVRKTHAALDGTVLPSDHPLWAKIYPPNDWGCRCTVIPAQGAAQTNLESAQQYANSPALKPYFRTHVGIEHVAFNEELHPYFERVKQFKSSITKQVELLAEENYNMPSVEKAVSGKGLPDLNFVQDKTQAQQQWAAAGKTVKAADGVEWNIGDRWDHVVEHHAADDRWKYINNTRDILENADEVWMSKEKLPDGTVGTFKRYVKYYKGQPMVMSYPVDRPDQWTMYAADIDSTGKYKKMRDSVRRGVLVHRK